VVLLAPVLIILALIFTEHPRSAAAAKNPGSTGTLEIGFLGSITTPSPNTLLFQRVLLNVAAVRLTPSSDPNIGDGDPSWVAVSVPPGLGRVSAFGAIFTDINFGGTFGPNGSTFSIGLGRSELQLDLNALQQNAELFNGAQIPPQTYNQEEVVLDQDNPGNLVPVCGSGSPRGEGCITYTAVLLNPGTNPRTISPINLARNGFAPLVLNVAVNIPAGAPINSTNTVTIDPTISVIPNSVSGISPVLAGVSGAVSNPATTGEAVTAEIHGTNQIVATVNTQLNGNYVFALPSALPGGTTYDFYASGKKRSFAVNSSQPALTQGTFTNINFTEATAKAASLAGRVKDTCTGAPIQAATLQLLEPDPASGGTDCTTSPPTHCVVVASASTDEVGHYPLPGSSAQPAPFKAIPLSGSYTLKVSAAGYNPATQAVTVSGNALTCLGLPNNACDFSLERGEVDGTVTLNSTNSGPPLDVMVMAEDGATNKIEGLTMTTVPTGSKTGPFKMVVPDNVSPLDFFAAVEDLFGSDPQKDTGHTIAVQSGVLGPAKCAVSATAVALTGFDCVGHGSIAGTATVSNQNTSIILSKAGVDLIQSAVGPPGSNEAGQFAFCAPADPLSYTLQRFDSASPGSTAAVTSATPTAIPSPCSGICDNGSMGKTCLLCTGTSGVTLP
jgi:hypothetical protein